jgi:hypothetical protein
MSIKKRLSDAALFGFGTAAGQALFDRAKRELFGDDAEEQEAELDPKEKEKRAKAAAKEAARLAKEEEKQRAREAEENKQVSEGRMDRARRRSEASQPKKKPKINQSR